MLLSVLRPESGALVQAVSMMQCRKTEDRRTVFHRAFITGNIIQPLCYLGRHHLIQLTDILYDLLLLRLSLFMPTCGDSDDK